MYGKYSGEEPTSFSVSFFPAAFFCFLPLFLSPLLSLSFPFQSQMASVVSVILLSPPDVQRGIGVA